MDALIVEPAGKNKNMVSIIVPVFNREKFIAQALNSALEQTYNNFEIIAVDDGSGDSSLSILNEYKERFPEKIVVIQQENSGPSVARNNAILAARGSSLLFSIVMTCGRQIKLNGSWPCLMSMRILHLCILAIM